MMVTIFTPIYNRANLIGKLYQSLLCQTDFDFEWLIVDDGSTDNIAEVVAKWKQEERACFPIRFFQQKNGGKHRAINRGVLLAKGEAFFIVDSDDYLEKDAVELIHRWWEDVKTDDCYAGVSGLKADTAGKVVGGRPAFEWYVDALNIERGKYGLLGDKAEAYKTSVLKKYPFPEFEDENFLQEGIVWDRIAHDGYKIRWFNQVIYICEYRADGLTRHGWEICLKNPIGWGLYIWQTCDFYCLDDAACLQQYLIYYVGLRDGLSGEEICSNLRIDKKTFNEITQLHYDCIQKTIQGIGKKIALYGIGLRGKRILKLYQNSGVEICFVMDRTPIESPYRQLTMNDRLPAVDAIIVTPKEGKNEIEIALEKITTNKIMGYDEWKRLTGLTW